MNVHKPRIMIIDAQENCLMVMKSVLEAENLEVQAFGHTTKALELFEDSEPDLVVVDTRMPIKNGLEVLKEVRHIRPSTRVILLATQEAIPEALEGMRRGADSYVIKPIVPLDLLLQLKELFPEIVFKTSLKWSKGAAEEVSHSLIGQSQRIRNINTLLDKISATDLPVLILGETGTDKERIARMLHAYSARANGPLQILNCAAYQDTLLDADLFGYEKGAFPDARVGKAGKMETAHGGTLFITEAQELRPSVQGKLLKLLQNRTFERLGSGTPKAVDVRLVVGASENLAHLVEEGAFSFHLHALLNTVTMQLPAVREVKEDIPILAQHYIAIHGKELHKSRVKIGSDALEALTNYAWIGNHLEMNACVRRTVAQSDGKEIKVFDLPSYVASPPEDMLSSLPVKTKSLLLDDVERDHILNVLDMVEGNKSSAAVILGIHRDTLLRKLKKFGVTTN